MQPHLPPVNPSKTYAYRWEPTEQNNRIITEPHDPWKSAREGKYPETVIQDYKDNLNVVLDDLLILLENVDASKVVITSDHGQYLGENGFWGHEDRNRMDAAVRHVPWWETTAEDNNTHEPASYDKTPITDMTDQLKALGYM
jgi:membrane-anchored protein YejM (alkaline phosphatase superfamily)